MTIGTVMVLGVMVKVRVRLLVSNSHVTAIRIFIQATALGHVYLTISFDLFALLSLYYLFSVLRLRFDRIAICYFLLTLTCRLVSPNHRQLRSPGLCALVRDISGCVSCPRHRHFTSLIG